MSREDHLPDVYQQFQDAFPSVARALDDLAISTSQAGPLDSRTERLVKLAMAIAAQSPGSTRSNVRKALAAGDSIEQIRQVALLAITTCGFPTAIAGLGWIDEVASKAEEDREP